MTKSSWQAPERNKGPILEVLARVLPAHGTVLEIASGTGQHAVHFARHLPGLTFQPSDIDAENLASIRAWVREAALPNLRDPIELDVCSSDWGVGQVEAVFNANMIHIAPWECALGLVSGATRHLTPQGVLVTYGPYTVGGAHTSPSNEAFDRDLKSRDPRWGVRDVGALESIAAEHGLSLVERVAMPANNQCLVFTRAGAP